MIGYRLAVATDAVGLHALLSGLAAHDGTSAPGDVASLVAHGFGAQPLFRAVLAEDQGRMLGMVLFYPCYSTLRGKPGLFVEDLYVLPAARGTGLGRALIAAALRAADWGPVYVTLGVDPGNATAQAFYARLGFARRGYDLMLLEGAGLTTLQALP